MRGRVWGLAVTLLCVVGGCGHEEFVTVASVGGKVGFTVERLAGSEVLATLVVVVEIRTATDAPELCRLKLTDKGRRERAKIVQWAYGDDIGDTYKALGCHPLVPGPRYEVRLMFEDHSSVATRFRIQADGSVVNLERSSIAAMM
jgi:hypothetical protein